MCRRGSSPSEAMSDEPSALARGRSPPRRVEQTANASVMLRDIDRRATSILSTDRNVDESVERTGVLTQRIAEGGGVGEGEALVSWLHRVK